MHDLNTLCLRVICEDTDCETDLRIGRGCMRVLNNVVFVCILCR